jgi:hypothetical protein
VAGPPKGSFEPWSDLVRGAIWWAGGADPLDGVQRIRDQGDEDLDKLRTLLAAWHEKFEGIERTVAQAIEKAGDSGDVRHALAAFCGSNRPESKPFGNALRKVRGRIVSGRAFERGSEDRNGVARSKVVSTILSEKSAGSAGSLAARPDG